MKRTVSYDGCFKDTQSGLKRVTKLCSNSKYDSTGTGQTGEVVLQKKRLLMVDNAQSLMLLKKNFGLTRIIRAFGSSDHFCCSQNRSV